MGGFGSGRHGGTVTSEGTRSYVIGASVLTRARRQVGHLAKGTFHADDGNFAIEVIVDTTDPSGPFMELIHKTRDDREGDLIVRDRIGPLAGGAGGSNTRGSAVGRQSSFCQTADSISGAVRATASATPANAREASIAFSDGRQC